MPKISPFTFWTIMGIAAIGIVSLSGSKTPHVDTQSAVSPPTPKPLILINNSEAMRSERNRIITGLLKQGAFRKVDMDGIAARVTVGPSFYTVDFDTKQSLIGLVYAQKFDGTSYGDFVRVIDSMNGKEIGLYSAGNGGLKLY